VHHMQGCDPSADLSIPTYLAPAKTFKILHYLEDSAHRAQHHTTASLPRICTTCGVCLSLCPFINPFAYRYSDNIPQHIMSSIARPHVPRHRRQRIVLTCLECRKRKQRVSPSWKGHLSLRASTTDHNTLIKVRSWAPM
jgi:ferredoxin